MQIRGRSRPERSSMYWSSGQSVVPGAIWTPPMARIRCASAATLVGLETDARRALAVEHVDGVHEPHGLRLVGHHERVRTGAAAEEPHALEQVARRDPGRREHEILARREVLGSVNATLVAVAHPGAAGALVVAAVLEAGLDLAAETAHRRGRDHPFRGAAGAHHRVHAGARHRAADRRREVTVADELDPGAGRPHLRDEVGVAGAVEDDHSDVLGAATER